MRKTTHWMGPFVLALCVLGLVESVLAHFNRGTPPERVDLSRGFGGDSRSFAKADDGGWILLDEEGAPTHQQVPPKAAGSFRILLFGGSNVAGFPDRYLEGYLRHKVPQTRWDVVNLGRSGYGSGRVLRLVAEALDIAEPDLVIVYSGHNEFVERGFQIDVEAQWRSAWMASAGGFSRRLRTVNTLAAAFEVEERDDVGDWNKEDHKFDHFTFEQSLHQLSWFDQNLTRMTELVAERGVPALLCTVVYNHFAMPWVAAADPALSPEELREFEGHLKAARTLYTPEVGALLPAGNALRLHPQDWRGCFLAKLQGSGSLPEPRPLQGPLAGHGMAPPPEVCWSKKVVPFYDALVAFHERRATPELERAETHLQRAVELDPKHARASFELGLVSYVLGRDLELVADLLDRAGDFDCAPRRASRAINDRTRRVAATRGVALFDAEEVFRELVPEGLIGWETMRDQCHLHRGARRALMEQLGLFLVQRQDLCGGGE